MGLGPFHSQMSRAGACLIAWADQTHEPEPVLVQEPYSPADAKRANNCTQRLSISNNEAVQRANANESSARFWFGGKRADSPYVASSTTGHNHEPAKSALLPSKRALNRSDVADWALVAPRAENGTVAKISN